MKIITVVNGFLKENAYIAGDNDCYIIDPGKFSKLIIDKVKNNFNNVKAILLTHGHFDHCECVDELANYYNCPVYMSKFDIEQVDGTYLGHYKLQNMVAVLKTKTIDAIELNDSNIVVLETPGHTKGSVCYLFKKENILFSGDTLFFESVGRCDLPGGSKNDLDNSINIIKELNDNIEVYPGHEQKTTIEHEKRYNPFF